MKRLSILLSVYLLIAGPSALAAGSPLDQFAEQNKINAEKADAVAAATTAKELAKLGAVPEDMAAEIDAMPAEQRQQYIDAIKREADTHIAVYQRIEGDRAAVLKESPVPGTFAEIVLMEKGDEGWVQIPNRRPYHTTVAGARGSFEVTGAVEDSVSDALVEKARSSRSKGQITLMDRIGEALTGEVPSTLSITLPPCPEPGDYGLVEPLPRYSATFMDGPRFDAEAGSITITEVTGNRASARFSLKLNGWRNPDESVEIEGTLTEVPVTCDGDW